MPSLQHGGDFGAAASDLAQKGFGQKLNGEMHPTFSFIGHWVARFGECIQTHEVGELVTAATGFDTMQGAPPLGKDKVKQAVLRIVEKEKQPALDLSVLPKEAQPTLEAREELLQGIRKRLAHPGFIRFVQRGLTDAKYHLSLPRGRRRKDRHPQDNRKSLFASCRSQALANSSATRGMVARRKSGSHSPMP